MDEVRWAFMPPQTWLVGVGINLVLSLLWLVIAPLTGRPHHDWAILVGTYFAVFVLADVTTTNVLGLDAPRVRLNLMRGVRLWRILLVKNLALLVIVGLPTLLATALITLYIEADDRLELTLPGVLFPIFTWLGVGNLISVAMPVAALPLRRRWHQRHEPRVLARWLFCLGLPYVLCLGADPVGDLPPWISRHLHLRPGAVDERAIMVTVLGLIFWGVGTAAALAVARVRGVRFDDLGHQSPPGYQAPIRSEQEIIQ